MKLIPSESSAPTQLLSRQHFVRISPLAATLMDLPASVANKRLTAELSPLDATLTKNRGEGGVTLRRKKCICKSLVFYALRTLPSSVSCKSFACHWVEKSLHLCLAGLRIRWFDPIAEASELPKHLRSAELLRSFGDRWAPFFVTNSLVQDQPDQPTLSMGDGPNGLIVSQARDRAAIHDLEDASFGSGCGVSSLIE